MSDPSTTPNSKWQVAATVLWKSRRAGSVLDALPEPLRPASRHEGYAIQSAFVAASDRAPTGWKIAATSRAGQVHIGVDGPLAGRLLAEHTVRSGATLSLRANRMRVAEPEFAFRCGTRLPSRPEPYSEIEVLDAMDALLPALEVPDSRFADFATAGAAQLIADCACARHFVLGSPAAVDWRMLDLAAHRVRGQVVGRTEREGQGANVLSDPRVALVWLVNELRDLGIALEPDEIVTTGTCMAPLEIQRGDHVVADFGPLGVVEASFD